MTTRDAINAVLEAYLRQSFARLSLVQASEMQAWLYSHETELPATIRDALFEAHNVWTANGLYAE